MTARIESMVYLLSRPIAIVEYDTAWPLQYEEERQRLLVVLHPVAVQVEHIGSTSVPGLAAKPIIDISVSVGDLAAVTEYVEALRALGYEEQPIHPRFQRRMFCRGPYNEGTHHLHFTVHGGEVWAEPLLFRDYLRAHPAVAREYGEVKKASAAEHGRDLNGYHDTKAPIVEAIMQQARTWQHG